jgi:hypothetical protein
VDAAHGSGNLTPEPNSTAGAAAVGGVSKMTEPTTGASSSQAQ